MQKIEDMLQPYVASGEATSIFSISGFGVNTSNGFIAMTLADWEHRDRSQQEIAAEITQKLVNVPGVRASTRSGNSLGVRGGGSGLQFALLGDNYETLGDHGQRHQGRARKGREVGPRLGQLRDAPSRS